MKFFANHRKKTNFNYFIKKLFSASLVSLLSSADTIELLILLHHSFPTSHLRQANPSLDKCLVLYDSRTDWLLATTHPLESSYDVHCSKIIHWLGKYHSYIFAYHWDLLRTPLFRRSYKLIPTKPTLDNYSQTRQSDYHLFFPARSQPNINPSNSWDALQSFNIVYHAA